MMRNAHDPIRFYKSTELDDRLRGRNLLALPTALLHEYALLAGSVVTVQREGSVPPLVLTVGVHFQQKLDLLCDDQYGMLLNTPFTVSRGMPETLLSASVVLLCETGTDPETVRKWLDERGRVANTHVLYAEGNSRFIFIEPFATDLSIRAVRINNWRNLYFIEEGHAWRQGWQGYEERRDEVKKAYNGFRESRLKDAALRKDIESYCKAVEVAHKALELAKARADRLKDLAGFLRENRLADRTRQIIESFRRTQADVAQALSGPDFSSGLMSDGWLRPCLDQPIRDVPYFAEHDISAVLMDAERVRSECSIPEADPSNNRLEMRYRQAIDGLEHSQSLADCSTALGVLRDDLANGNLKLNETVVQIGEVAQTLNSCVGRLKERAYALDHGSQDDREALAAAIAAFKDLPVVGVHLHLDDLCRIALNCTETDDAVERFAALRGCLTMLQDRLVQWERAQEESVTAISRENRGLI